MNPGKDRILVADDSEHSFTIISEILDIVGSDVELFYAEDGRKACNMAVEIVPDLILMDVIMPEMNGIEAVKYLRTTVSTANIPIIVLSATESLKAAYDAGANDFISKPFQKYELLIKVRSALSLVNHIKEIRKQNQELLLSIYNLPLSEQKEKLYRTMVDWKRDNDQVDDIPILGFRI